MQASPKSVLELTRIDILLFGSFSNHCLANTVEPLRAANTISRKAHYSWRFLSLDGAPVASSSGLQVSPHGALAAGDGEMLIVMPSYGFRDLEGLDVSRQLRRAAGRYACLAGLDTGSWLLARAGLLDGCRATIHWEELSSFAETFPGVEVERERFVIDRNRITCSGAMAAFDLVLHLIEKAHGAMLALEVEQLFMMRESARSHATPMRARERVVNRALQLMQENLETPLGISAMARQIGCTQKVLEQRMRGEFGTTPSAVYRRLRLNLVRKLACDTDLSMAEIAGRSGYENASAMSRAFRKEFGLAPRDLRRRMD